MSGASALSVMDEHISQFGSPYVNDDEQRLRDARDAVAGLLEVARKCRDYLSCIPESAAGGDDEAVGLARAATAAIAWVSGEQP